MINLIVYICDPESTKSSICFWSYLLSYHLHKQSSLCSVTLAVEHTHAPDPSRAGPDGLRSTSPRPAASAAPSCCTSRWPGHVSSGCYTRVPEKNLMNKRRHVSPASCRSGRLPLLNWTGLTGFTSFCFFFPEGLERREKTVVRGDDGTQCGAGRFRVSAQTQLHS